MENSSESRYVVCQLVLGAKESIEITEPEFNNISISQRRLFELTSLEEKFFAICEHYRETEEFIFKSTLNNMLFGFHNVQSIHSVGAQFGRMTASMLSSSRLYLDTVASHIEFITDSKVSKTDIKVIFSREYDASLAYRTMEAIRNYTQHRAFPVHSSSYPTSWNDERTILSFASNFYFDAARVKNNEKFKKSIKAEIESVGGKLDLKHSLREYFACLCNIHIEVREKIKRYRTDSIKYIGNHRKQWNENFPDTKMVGLVACKLIGPIRDKEVDAVYIDPQIDEYRESLEAKTRSPKNMSKRNIPF